MLKQNQDSLEIIKRITPIFRDVLDNDDLVITPATTAADVDGWDSLAHIHLVVSIEKALKMRFSAEEVSSLENVGDLVALILKKQANG
jgi:acyl carrier protein